MQHVAGFLFAALAFFGSLFGYAQSPAQPPETVVARAAPRNPDAATSQATTHASSSAPVSVSSSASAPEAKSASGSSRKANTSPGSSAQPSIAAGQVVLSHADLLALASDAYADGAVPLGDYKYVTDAPKKGYVYLCNVHKDNPGSMVMGPWVHGETWNFLEKVSVSGSVSWPNAQFSDSVAGATRSLVGNGLPVGYATGIFPVQTGDPASKYDPNPNTISAQTLRDSLPADPQYSAVPHCMGGEVGVMTDGVPLFDAFDAGLRDAPAHELQDGCDGHPQGSGEYHYHSLSSCFKDIGVETALGFAYDGFPITGPEVAPGKYLTTDDLDVCHGITSEVMLDGKPTVTYHYVMTKDFPYSASCFRGKPITTGPSGGQPNASRSGQQSAQQGQLQGPQSGQGPGQNGGPPQQAIDACAGKSADASCSFETPNGTISGACRTPPNSSLACVPH